MNMFATAKVIEAPKPAKKKAEKEEIQLDGLEDYAVLDSLIKNLTAVRDMKGAALKEEMLAHFSKSDTRPENFRGVDGLAKASCEMRCRGANSALSDDEVKLFEECKIPYDTTDVIRDQFVINPEYANDQELLQRVSDALSKVKGLPADFVMKQQGYKKRTVSDDSIDKAFETKQFAKLSQQLVVLALKPTVTDFPLDKQLEKVAKLVGLTPPKKEKK